MFEILIKNSKAKCRKGIIIGICGIIVSLLIFSTLDIPLQIKALNSTPETLTITENMSENDIIKDYAQLNATFMFDYYAYYDWNTSLTKLSTPTKLHPAMIWTSDTNSPKLIVIEVPYSKFETAQKLVDVTNSFQTNNSVNEEFNFYSAKGSVCKLTPDEQTHLEENFAILGMDILPYKITDTKIGNFNLVYFILACLIFILGTFMLIYSLIEYKKTTNKNHVQENFENIYGNGIYEEAVADCENGENISNVFIGEKYMAFSDRFPVVIEINDLIWIYKREERNYGIKSPKVMLNTKNGKSYEILCKKGEFDKLCSAINNKNNIVAYGYTNDLNTKFKKNIDEFIKMIADENKPVNPEN